VRNALLRAPSLSMQDQSRLLLSISNVVASQIYEGEQSVLAQGTLNVTLLSQRCDPPTPPADDFYGTSTSSSQQLSRDPTSSGSQDYQATIYPSEKKRNEVDDDLFLFVSIGQDQFDLPLPANTKIIPQGKSAYLIPSQDIPNALLRLDLGSSSLDDLETFEILLSQFTAYEERQQDLARKDLVLVDSEDGHVVGSVPQDNLVVYEDPTLSQPGHEKDPVMIDIAEDPSTHKNMLRVSPAMVDYRAQSSLIRTADMISSGIVFSSNTISKGIESSANWYISKRPTSDLPVTFQPTTLERVRKIHNLSNSAVAISSKATGLLASAAHSLGSGVRRTLRSEDKPGKKPSLLNKSLIAFETIADSIDTSTKQLLGTTSNVATNVVRHKYGDRAAEISHGLGSTVRNVGLVYVDARGVTRKALIKGAAKGMLFKAKVGNGNEVILGGGPDELSDASPPPYEAKSSTSVPTQAAAMVPGEDTTSYSSLDHPGAWKSGKERT
jgi:spartin